jgi:hypothetical protein
MNEPDYQRSNIATTERIVATILVAAWIICAFMIGGHVLAIRAAILFMVPLSFIWMPDIFARIATLDDKWNRQFIPKASKFSVRLIGWFVIVGVPAVWIAFQFSLQS